MFTAQADTMLSRTRSRWPHRHEVEDDCPSATVTVSAQNLQPASHNETMAEAALHKRPVEHRWIAHCSVRLFSG
jgi:hypothetical protein